MSKNRIEGLKSTGGNKLEKTLAVRIFVSGYTTLSRLPIDGTCPEIKIFKCFVCTTLLWGFTVSVRYIRSLLSVADHITVNGSI